VVAREELQEFAAKMAGQGLSRRALLSAGVATLGASVATDWLASSPAAAANGLGAGEAPAGLTGTIADLKHVVVLVQENRSTDHYYGMVPGVRGFADKQALTYQNGLSVFHQPDAMRSDGGYLLPFRLQSGKVNALGMGSLPHGWTTDGLPMWNHGAWDRWTQFKTELTMGHFTGQDVPWHWALVNNWTICDHNHCSFNGSTDPNRFYVWSGTIDPNGVAGGPEISNPVSGSPAWPSLYDFMQDAGVDWRSMGAAGNGNDMGARTFQRIHAAAQSADPAVRDQAVRGKLVDADPIHLLPNQMDPANIDLILADFIEACETNTLPEVTFVSSSGGWDEHPASNDRGMAFTYGVIKAMASNPEVWNSTLLITTYDENDGLFDHVLPPMAEPGTKDEFINGSPLGPGGRVPMLLISPWTRRNGGAVCSEVFDHTSISQFFETWLAEARGYDGVTKPAVLNTNITEWRRQVCGNLLSGFDFANPDFSVPQLPDANLLVAAVAADIKLPAATPPKIGQQAMPVPEAEDPSNRRLRRPVPYAQNATLEVDRATGRATVTLTNDGDSGCSLLLYPDDYLPFRATPYTVLKGHPKTHVWDSRKTNDAYAMSIYGPDRFVRSFAGTVLADDMSLGGRPTASSELVTSGSRVLRIHLGNEGEHEVFFTLSPNDFAGSEQTVVLGAGEGRTIDWPLDADGYYDVVVTDTSNTGFRHRYAGRINATA
jgi:phospholipase C